jgi:phage-related minor tail protein
MIHKAEREQRQAINPYNQQARQHNAQVKRAVDEYNRDVDRYNAALRKQKREVDAYNRKVDAHNVRVRRDRQRLINELKRLERQASSTRYVPVQASFRVLNEAYQRVDVEAGVGPASPWPIWRRPKPPTAPPPQTHFSVSRPSYRARRRSSPTNCAPSLTTSTSGGGGPCSRWTRETLTRRGTSAPVRVKSSRG